ncbi:hypothetical protein AB6A40_008017 [Gnathostoma spinigerum]|uniref:Reverse transcriptase domain-containing protein n=1 Tax=Gnathostoma spinigerum TaxID=75299 RepID=A0ABD6EMY1_9BILA
MDHIFVLNQMIERAREYRLPPCLLFVDYEKAFDNVEVNAVLNALKSQGVEDSYIKILAEANSGCTTDINVFGSPIRTLSRQNCLQPVSNRYSGRSLGDEVSTLTERYSPNHGSWML